MLTQLRKTKKGSAGPNSKLLIFQHDTSKCLDLLLFWSISFLIFANCFGYVEVNGQSVACRCLLSFEDEAVFNLWRPEGQRVSSYPSNLMSYNLETKLNEIFKGILTAKYALVYSF